MHHTRIHTYTYGTTTYLVLPREEDGAGLLPQHHFLGLAQHVQSHLVQADARLMWWVVGGSDVIDGQIGVIRTHG